MNTQKPFSLGILVGRFQMPHLGHQSMIDTSLAICDHVGVLIGSSQESGTAVNPFSWELRRDMLRDLYGDRIEIAPLPDIGAGNNSAWGDYVLLRAMDAFGAVPELIVSGVEGRRVSWFQKSGASPDCAGTMRHPDTASPKKTDTSERHFPSPAELYLPKTIDISASELRGFLIKDDFAAWSAFTDSRLHARFCSLRELVLASESHRETSSL